MECFFLSQPYFSGFFVFSLFFGHALLFCPQNLGYCICDGFRSCGFRILRIKCNVVICDFGTTILAEHHWFPADRFQRGIAVWACKRLSFHKCILLSLLIQIYNDVFIFSIYILKRLFFFIQCLFDFIRDDRGNCGIC